MATTAKGQQRLEILGCGAYTMEKGGKAQRRNPPPPPGCSQVPHSVLASCLRRACDMRATKGRRHGRPPPPPHTPAPPRVGDAGRGGREAAPSPRTKRQGGEAAARGWGTDHTTVPVESTRRASLSGGTTGGANAG